MKMGILVVNKSEDMTSHDVVSILRKKLNLKRIGHTGTLDPMATGVLPICIDKATRVSDYIMAQGKSYIAKLKFGYSTTTYDSSGDILDKSDNTKFSDKEISDVLDTFVGDIEQIPPIYSAIKVKGKKLYEYAREGKSVELKPRKITIYDIKLLENEDDSVKIEVSCSKGTYIRSLIHDIGIKLNTYAHMTDLQRNRVGKFYIENSYNIDKINSMTKEEILNKLINIEKALYNLPKIDVKEDIKYRLINGQRINVLTLESIKNLDIVENKDTLLLVNGEFIGIAKVNENILKMEKVLCQQ